MNFPLPGPWNRDTADAERDERKRKESPPSYFYSQGWSIVLAANYFSDERLTSQARGGVASKHRHKIHLALYGQLLAAFEYLLKDFFARTIDITSLYDEKVVAAKWIQVDASKILVNRYGIASPGAILLHSTQGWHYPEDLNSRFSNFFEYQPLSASEITTLNKLWILRHSVAHNTGFVTHNDAVRLGAESMSEKVVSVDGEFLSASFEFLGPIAEKIAREIGSKITEKWIKSISDTGPSFDRDKLTYTAIKRLAEYVPSRTKELSNYTESDYHNDWARFT